MFYAIRAPFIAAALIAAPLEARHIKVDFIPGNSFTLPTIDKSIERVLWADVIFGGSIDFFHRSYGMGLDPVVMEFSFLSHRDISVLVSSDAVDIGYGRASIDVWSTANVHGGPSSFIDTSYNIEFYGYGPIFDGTLFYSNMPTVMTNIDVYDWPVVGGPDVWSNLTFTRALIDVETTPVPELQSWAMILCGFAAVGATLRFRRAASNRRAANVAST